jgi:hypothetical protein
MQFLKYHPHILLRQFIDFYWVLQTELNSLKISLFEDATTDVFANLSNSNGNISTSMPVAPQKMYLYGNKWKVWRRPQTGNGKGAHSNLQPKMAARPNVLGTPSG